MVLDELIESYGKHNDELNSIKKTCDSEKSQIKDLMATSDSTKYSSDNYTINYVTQERVAVDESMMLNIIKDYWSATYPNQQCPLIETKEFINMDALETALYNKELPNEVIKKLSDTRKITEVVTLRCTKRR